MRLGKLAGRERISEINWNVFKTADKLNYYRVCLQSEANRLANDKLSILTGGLFRKGFLYIDNSFWIGNIYFIITLIPDVIFNRRRLNYGWENHLR